MLLIATQVAADDELPFVVENKRNLKWNRVEAVRIYDAACAVVQREMKLKEMPRPHFLLILGDEKNSADSFNFVSTVHMKKWDRATFANGVVVVIMHQLVNPQQIGEWSKMVEAAATAVVTVEELDKE